MDLPELWRTEMWHPLSVHFPLAILLIGTAFYSVSFFFHKTYWKHCGNIVLLTGTISAWIAI
ncbi:MAG: hypothetical protein R6U95_08650 [Bacteroidales bacterium]